MPTTFSEGRYAAEFVLSEANFHRSRDNIIVGASQTIVAGAVLGRKAVVADVVATPTAAAGNTGGATIAMDATAVTSSVKDGRYVGIAASATTVRWQDPAGKDLGLGTHGSLFAKGGIRVTVTAAGTTTAVGDEFYVDVAADAADFQYFEHNAAATDGTEVAAAIALYPATTGVGETAAISAITRDAEVNGKILTWKSGATDAQKADGTQALAALGVIVR